jgi:coproporphyrinogen III oxidase-like Fe-S oxidoreductase
MYPEIVLNPEDALFIIERLSFSVVLHCCKNKLEKTINLKTTDFTICTFNFFMSLPFYIISINIQVFNSLSTALSPLAC